MEEDQWNSITSWPPYLFLDKLIEAEWHICVGNLTIIGSGKGLSLGRCLAIIWTNARISLTGHWGTNFNRNSYMFIKKIHSKMSSPKWPPFCLGLNVLRCCLCRILWDWQYANILRPGQNSHHFADNIFKCIFMNENVWILTDFIEVCSQGSS